MVHKNIGCRSEVFRGKAKRTSGGLKKEDIIRNKYGRYVSKERSEKAKESSHLGKWLFKKGGKPSNRSAANLLYETIAKEREMERKKVVPGRLYRKEATDSKPNEPISKALMARAMAKIKREGWDFKWKNPTAKPKKSPVKKPAKPARPKKYVIKKPSKKKPDKSVYLLPEPEAAKKKKQKKSGK